MSEAQEKNVLRNENWLIRLNADKKKYTEIHLGLSERKME